MTDAQRTSRNKYGALGADDSCEVTVGAHKGPQQVCCGLYPDGFKKHLIFLLKLCWPIVIIQLTQFGYSAIAMMFCGHLGKVQLDGMALASSLINVIGISVGIGLCSACDTLFSQIYGSSNKKLAGVVLQRSCVIMSLITLPCWAVLLNVEPLMVLLGQDPEVSRLAGTYILIFMPAFLNVVYPSMIVNVVGNVLNVLLHYIFIYQLNMGINGSALSVMICHTVACLGNLSYILISGVYKKTWPGWTWNLFQEWGMFFKIAIFGLVMVCMEWWSFEIGILVAGLIGPTELGAQSIIFQFNTIFFMVPSGLGIATSIMTGQHLGAGRALSAKTTSRVGITVASCLGFLSGVIIIACSNYLPYIYTNVTEVQMKHDKCEVVDMISSVLPLVGIYFTFGFNTYICSGIIRATGRQNIGALIVASCYVVAMSAGIPAMYYSGLIIAFWGSQACSILIQVTLYFILILRMDWDRQVDMALERAKVVKKARRASQRMEIGEGVGKEGDNQESAVDEESALLSKSDVNVVARAPAPIRKYSAYEPPEPILVTKPLSVGQLILRRGLLILVFLSLFIASIIIRIKVPVPTPNSPDLTPNTTLTTPLFTTDIM